MGCIINAMPLMLYSREREQLSIIQEWAPGTVWMGAENLTPHSDSIPEPSNP